MVGLVFSQLFLREVQSQHKNVKRHLPIDVARGPLGLEELWYDVFVDTPILMFYVDFLAIVTTNSFFSHFSEAEFRTKAQWACASFEGP